MAHTADVVVNASFSYASGRLEVLEADTKQSKQTDKAGRLTRQAG